MNEVRAVMWCHGGCFTGGDISYDKALRQHLQKKGFLVIPIEFKKTSWVDAQLDIIQACVLYPSENYILGGISSGGLLAHQVANILHKDAFLLCPVIQPYDRHFSLPPSLQKRQLDFFGSLEEMRKSQNEIQGPNKRRQIIIGKKDTRAPLKGVAKWFFDNQNSCKGSGLTLLDADHELCRNPPLDTSLQCVRSLFNSGLKNEKLI